MLRAIGKGGSVGVRESLDGGFSFVADAIGIVMVAEGFGGVVAIFLEGFDLGGDAVEHGHAAFIVLWVGREELRGGGREKELGELRGGGLKADFGKVTAQPKKPTPLPFLLCGPSGQSYT